MARRRPIGGAFAGAFERIRCCWPYAAAALGVWVFLVLHLLPLEVMGEQLWNEADVLPLARQAADPQWLPNDWYLNQNAGYRFAFQHLAGPLVRDLGFVPAALLGRAASYALVSAALAVIAGGIGLRPWMLLLAVASLFSLHPAQSTTGGEWFVGGFEAKAIAWGLALLGIGAAVHARPALAMLLAGLAASFHVLVGGWVTVALWGWLLADVARGTAAAANDERGRIFRGHLRTFARCAIGTIVGAAGAAVPLWAHLSTPPLSVTPSPNFIYVFLRLPHHLNPASWPPLAWLQLAFFVLVLIASVAFLRRLSASAGLGGAGGSGLAYPHRALHLAGIAVVAMVPFAGGLLAATVDGDGTLLKYYPFRVAGVLLPLSAYLLGAVAVQQAVAFLSARQQRAFVIVVWVAIGLLFATASRAFERNLASLAESTAPGGAFAAHGEAWAAACDAVRALTPDGAVVVTPPAGGCDFTWRAGRARVANFKMLPQNPAAIVEWHARMTDLANGLNIAAVPGRYARYEATKHLAAELTAGYKSLSTRGATRLMSKYAARHFLTTADHRLALPVLYANDRYVLYAAPVLPVPDSSMFSAR